MSKYVKVDDLQAYCDNQQDHSITPNVFQRMNHIEVVLCKDCKYFEIKDWWGDFNGIPILATSDCPTCNKWGDGCMTKPEGYCFLAEHK